THKPVVNKSVGSTHDTSPVDKWSSRASSWAQVITLFIVVFGYFYTVRPAFQNQLLQEQSAKLQLQIDAQELELKRITEQRADAARRLNAVNSNLEQATKQKIFLEQALRLARNREMEARAAANTASEKMSGQAKALDESRLRLLILEVASRLI